MRLVFAGSGVPANTSRIRVPGREWGAGRA